jgi:hypothetical protein
MISGPSNLCEVARDFYRDVQIPIIDVDCCTKVIQENDFNGMASTIRRNFIQNELNELGDKNKMCVVLSILEDSDAFAVSECPHVATSKHYNLKWDKVFEPDTTFINFLLTPPSVIHYINDSSFREMLGNIIMH